MHNNWQMLEYWYGQPKVLILLNVNEASHLAISANLNQFDTKDT